MGLSIGLGISTWQSWRSPSSRCWSCSPAQAATAIYYSSADNAYGWCAGYSHDRSDSCALDQCQKDNTDGCQVAVECGGGWGAAAFAEDPYVGFATDCDGDDAYSARSLALAACIVASNAICWTDTAFDQNAHTRSQSDNTAFDLAWYTQALLQIRNYKVSNADGVFGPESRAALKAYQTDVGLPADGQLSEAIVRSLLDAAGGVEAFSKIIKTDVLDKRADETGRFIYSDARSPNPAKNLSAELVTRSDIDQRTALATILAQRGSKCSVPATDASPIPDASTGVWSVTCGEGSYTLILSDDGSTVITTGATTVETDDSGKSADQPTDSSSDTSAPAASDTPTASGNDDGERIKNEPKN